MSTAFFFQRINDHIQYLRRIEKTLEGKGDFRGTPHTDCKLGLWLYGEGHAQVTALGSRAVEIFESVLEPHQRFHEASARALARQGAGDRAGSERAISEMLRLSVALINKLGSLDDFR